MRTRSSSFLFWFFIFITAGTPAALCTEMPLVFGGGFDKPIPADTNSNKGWMEDAVIDVDEHLIISDIDVAIDIEHTNAFDLKIFLQSPDGVQICLNGYDDANDFFAAGNYSGTIFDDDASEPIEQAQPPFSGRYRPKEGELLGVFEGTDAFGQWRLKIEDCYYSDAGRLKKCELLISVPEPSVFVFFVLGGWLVKRGNQSRLRS